MKKVQGFTLLEMVIVLAIISVLAVITYPDMRRMYERYELKTEAREMVSNLRSLRQTAIAEEHETSFQLDNTQRPARYFLYFDSGTTAKQVMFGPGISMERGNFGGSRVRFYPNGTSSISGTITLRNGAEQVQIIIYFPTGNIILK